MIGVFKTERLEDEAVLRNPFIRRISLTGCERIRELGICWAVKERAPNDNPSIGIILCAEKDDVEVEFALKSKVNPIGVAEYQLKPTLPKELKGKLPSSKELSEAIGLPEKKKKKR